MVGTIGSATFVVNNEVFVIPAGARNIDLNNTGGAIGYFKGNKTLTSASVGGVTKQPAFIKLAVKEAYSFAVGDKTYGEITIDATGTTIEVEANY